jgi:hypothetical protein
MSKCHNIEKRRQKTRLILIIKHDMLKKGSNSFLYFAKLWCFVYKPDVKITSVANVQILC